MALMMDNALIEACCSVGKAITFMAIAYILITSVPWKRVKRLIK